MSISFVCINFNNSKITKDYLLSVLAIKANYQIKIIIIDNASHKQDVEELSSFIESLNFKFIKLIKSKTNLGYFKGLNLGLKYLKNDKNDFIIIGNNDLTFDNNFLNLLTEKKVANNTLVIAPKIITREGLNQNPHFINKFTFSQKLFRRIYFSNFYVGLILQFLFSNFRRKFFKRNRIGNDSEQIIHMGYGACYILSNNFFKKFDELDAPVFLMGEEGILTNQILSVSGNILYIPDLIVNHLDHSSIKKLTSRNLYRFSKISYKYYLKNLNYIN